VADGMVLNAVAIFSCQNRTTSPGLRSDTPASRGCSRAIRRTASGRWPTAPGPLQLSTNSLHHRMPGFSRDLVGKELIRFVALCRQDGFATGLGNAGQHVRRPTRPCPARFAGNSSVHRRLHTASLEATSIPAPSPPAASPPPPESSMADGALPDAAALDDAAAAPPPAAFSSPPPAIISRNDCTLFRKNSIARLGALPTAPDGTPCKKLVPTATCLCRCSSELKQSNTLMTHAEFVKR